MVADAHVIVLGCCGVSKVPPAGLALPGSCVHLSVPAWTLVVLCWRDSLCCVGHSNRCRARHRTAAAVWAVVLNMLQGSTGWTCTLWRSS
jgi:hypothetical protein